MIVLLTDGISADLGPAVSRQIGAELAEEQIVLYVIHIGDEAMPSDMYELARPTGGQVFAAATPDALGRGVRPYRPHAAGQDEAGRRRSRWIFSGPSPWPGCWRWPCIKHRSLG